MPFGGSLLNIYRVQFRLPVTSFIPLTILIILCRVHYLGPIFTGIPGQIRHDIVVGASNLPYMQNTPLGALLTAALDRPVRLFNDANCALAAELYSITSAPIYSNIKVIHILI